LFFIQNKRVNDLNFIFKLQFSMVVSERIVNAISSDFLKFPDL
jgi:hypothetical protein